MRAPRFVAPTALALAITSTAQAQQQHTTVGGYGEVHYTNASGANSPGRVDIPRFVLFFSHTFNDRLAFRSELEVEHARIEAGGNEGEVALEQAYIDYRLGEAFTLRSGLVLIPVGIINETHEPPTFNGVARPQFERHVIPTTWREVGVGAAGTLTSGLGYRVYLVNGLLASEFSAGSGIRGGRQSGQQASFANPSLTGRLEYARPGLKLGGSFWTGGSANADTLVGTGTYDAPVTLLSADARWDMGPLSVRGVLATMSIGDAAAINTAYGNDVGSRISGGYLEGAYNLLSLLRPQEATAKLLGFVRHERFDTHAAVPAGVTRNAANARRITTVGLTFKPIPSVVFKADAQFASTDVLSLGMGYWF